MTVLYTSTDISTGTTLFEEKLKLGLQNLQAVCTSMFYKVPIRDTQTNPSHNEIMKNKLFHPLMALQPKSGLSLLL
jgi:hypothetical protein